MVEPVNINADVQVLSSPLVRVNTQANASTSSRDDVAQAEKKKAEVHFSLEELSLAASNVAAVVNKVAANSLAFEVEEGLDRVVVRVTSKGSNELVRQFPPEEFLTVAKFIAEQQNDVLSEDFLKGILFDTRS